MSSPLKSSNVGGAEQAFREAFIRLVENRPERLPLGTRVSQNAVALEAGRDPSALKKARYPTLIAEIQNWVRDHYQTPVEQGSNLGHSQRKSRRSQTDEKKDLTRQRDELASKLVEASAVIVELTMENQRLQNLTTSLQESLQARQHEPKRRSEDGRSKKQAAVTRASPQPSRSLPLRTP